MAARKKPKKRKSELLQYKFKYQIDKRRFPTPDDARRAVQLARDQFLIDGSEIPGVHVIASWRNPNNQNPEHANWKTSDDVGQSLSEVHRTLHGARGALRQLTTVIVRTPQVAKIEQRRITRSAAMKTYHERVKALRGPRMSYAQARAKYSRKFKKKRKR